MKRVMITGTGKVGFIGNNLVEAFNEKYSLLTPARDELDLTDYNAVSRYFDGNKVDVLIHAASGVNDILDTDLKMFFNLEKYSNNLEKIVYFGSGAEYDKRYDIINVGENDIGNSIPADGYGLAKYIMNAYARNSDNIYNLRFFGIFGKYEDWTYKFISNLCCKAIFDLPLTIRRECCFDYIYIDDLPDIVEWLIENKPDYNDYNFVSGKPVLLTEIADIIKIVSEKNLDISVLNPEGRNNEYTASNKRLKAQVSWFEPTSLYKAIEELFIWYFNNKDLIDLNILKKTK
ncbi:MAG: NAD(P)-dependent oxidoreductase [Oscillospiraceae bacterium]|nr:NAD(P)-dependent oxidoreductase [Oscillospiraceae bacterium]